MERGKLVYVASPYSSPDKVQQEIRFLSAVVATGYLMNKFTDLSFYSPISHTHPIATYCKLPGDWAFWKQFDETILSRCNAIWVLCLPGWKESKGVTAELEIANLFALEVMYILSREGGEYDISPTPHPPQAE